MRHLRVSVQAVISLFVALATLGSLSVVSHPQQGGRRRGHAARVSRVGATRLDHNDAVIHEVEQHDPVLVTAADGLSGQPRRATIAPPGHRPRHTRLHLHIGAGAALATAVIRPQATPHAAALSPVGIVALQQGASRSSLGRAPPRRS